ncbi:unnamed protein product [Nippostrongylus brasiliensis]|uniref:Remorin_C domain-containing protein n=1 Tax=Nippostrongylus brasiliensis TaxID=27835 RepID=A0A0N4XMC4_NIPBR|nr:unnamed protein product [Nippostrongylus brasiliensis]
MSARTFCLSTVSNMRAAERNLTDALAEGNHVRRETAEVSNAKDFNFRVQKSAAFGIRINSVNLSVKEESIYEQTPAKPSKPGSPVALPTIRPLVVSWKNLDDTHINDENVWNFEKRVDSKVWWPS